MQENQHHSHPAWFSCGLWFPFPIWSLLQLSLPLAPPWCLCLCCPPPPGLPSGLSASLPYSACLCCCSCDSPSPSVRALSSSVRVLRPVMCKPQPWCPYPWFPRGGEKSIGLLPPGAGRLHALTGVLVRWLVHFDRHGLAVYGSTTGFGIWRDKTEHPTQTHNGDLCMLCITTVRLCQGGCLLPQLFVDVLGLWWVACAHSDE